MSTTPRTSSARNEVRQVVPRPIELTETLLDPDIRERLSAARVAKPVLDGRTA